MLVFSLPPPTHCPLFCASLYPTLNVFLHFALSPPSHPLSVLSLSSIFFPFFFPLFTNNKQFAYSILEEAQQQLVLHGAKPGSVRIPALILLLAMISSTFLCLDVLFVSVLLRYPLPRSSQPQWTATHHFTKVGDSINSGLLPTHSGFFAQWSMCCGFSPCTPPLLRFSSAVVGHGVAIRERVHSLGGCLWAGTAAPFLLVSDSFPWYPHSSDV